MTTVILRPEMLHLMADNVALARREKEKQGRIFHANGMFKRLQEFIEEKETQDLLLNSATIGKYSILIPSEVVTYLAVESYFQELAEMVHSKLEYKLQTWTDNDRNIVLQLCW